MSTTQSMTATARPEHRSPVSPAVTVVNASNAELCAELDYRNVGTPQVARAMLLARAESYSGDARKFAEMSSTDVRAERYVSEEDCKRYAAMYRTVAGELRKVADSL